MTSQKPAAGNSKTGFAKGLFSRAFRQEPSGELGNTVFAERVGAVTLPVDCFAYEIKKGERGVVEFSGKIKPAKDQNVYVVHSGLFRVRFAPDASAAEFGIEADIRVFNRQSPPESLADLIIEAGEDDELPKQITVDDLAAAAISAIGEDLIQPCMSEAEWQQAFKAFRYQLNRRFGLTAETFNPVTLGVEDGVDAALAVFVERGAAEDENQTANSVQAEASTEQNSDTDAEAENAVIRTVRQTAEAAENAFATAVARSFRISRAKLRGPVFNPVKLDLRLQTRLNNQLPRLGSRVERLGMEHGDGLPTADRIRLRDLRGRIWSAHSSMAYINTLDAHNVEGKLSRRARRQRLGVLRQASDSLESLIHQVTLLESGEGDSVSVDHVAELDVMISDLKIALAIRAFGNN